MAITPTSLQPGVALGASLATVLTLTGTSNGMVKKATFTNTATTSVAITVSVLRSGATTPLAVISAFNLSPGQAYVASELSNFVLNAGDVLQAFASSASVVNFVASGYTF